MQKGKIILLFALLIAACEPIIIDDTTPTPGSYPTPTQEYNYWDTSCLPDGSEPINTNPCLSGEPPYDVEWLIEPNERNNGTITTPEYIEGHWRFWLAGESGTGFAGFIGLRLYNLAIEPNKCYSLNLGVFVLKLPNTPQNELNNITAQAFVHTDKGDYIPLGVHDVTEPYGFGVRVNPSPDWFWLLHSNEPMTIVLDVGMDQVHANARLGSNLDLEYIYFHQVDNALCSNVAPL